MTILATDIVGLGYPGGLAREIARAVNDGVAFAPNFVGLGMPSGLATELARQVNDGEYNSDFLIGLKMPPEMAELIVANAIPPWFDTTSLRDIEFELNESWANGIISTAAEQLTITRSGDYATARELDGEVLPFGPDALRLVTRGVIVENAVASGGVNTNLAGAVAGSPGTLPTGFISAVQSGVTLSVVATGTANGLPYVDIRWQGTPSASGGVSLSFCANNLLAAAVGDQWVTSCYVALVAGNLNNVAGAQKITLGQRFYTAGLTVQNVNPTYMALELDGTLRRCWISALGITNTAFVQGALRFDVTSGQAIDFTLRIAAPQTIEGAFPYEMIRTDTANVTRAADVVTVTSPGLPSAPPFSAVVELAPLHMLGGGVGLSANGYAISIGDGTTNNCVRVYGNGTSLFAELRTANTVRAQCNLGSWTGIYPAQVAFSLTSTRLAASRDGQPIVAATHAQNISGWTITQLMAAGALQAPSSRCRRITFYDTALSDADIQAKSWRSPLKSVAWWGDSLTFGYFIDWQNTSTLSFNFMRYANSPPGRLAALIGGKFDIAGYSEPRAWVYNGGVAGETSSEIEARMLAAINLKADVAVIWAGRNDLKYDEPTSNWDVPGLLQNIADMVAFAQDNGMDYRVLPVNNYYYTTGPVDEGNSNVNGHYGIIVETVAETLAATYGNKFVDVRSALIAGGDPVTDAADIVADRIPQSLICDGLSHLTGAGNQIVAQAVYDSL
jgi:lysophospholipase L1-like esterase